MQDINLKTILIVSFILLVLDYIYISIYLLNICLKYSHVRMFVVCNESEFPQKIHCEKSSNEVLLCQNSVPFVLLFSPNNANNANKPY